ncbi:BatD family protein [Methanolobus sp.]|uniref:BatD family protein n=1 Tax=Methanolobus sp. TaxID=1874737 RepID=UPI0025CDC26B|nr:BatD family protein [Methanolobus sp.]
MKHFGKTLTLISLAVLLLLISAGSASGKILFNDTIAEGDGYQINNYVIDVAEVFPDYDSVTLHVYEGASKTPKYDKMISVDGSYKFAIEGEDVEVTVISVHSGIVPRTKLLITVTDGSFINSKTLGVVSGGHTEAEFSGTPVLEITKTVDMDRIGAGDVVTVQVSVKNTGDDEATKVIFSDPTPAKFVLQQTLISPTGQISLDKGETRLIYTYTLKATESGTFVLSPTTAIYSNSIGDDFPQASSNTPVITVEDSSKKANLDITLAVDEYTVDRKDDLQGTIRIKNTGESSASAVTVNLIVPTGMEYSDGDSGIEIISGVPTIYMESFGIQQEKEISFSLKAMDEGTYTLSTQNSYRFSDGVDPTPQIASSTSVTNAIYVKKGKYDHLLEQPVYIYLIPLIVIGVIAGLLFHRHRQYKF